MARAHESSLHSARLWARWRAGSRRLSVVVVVLVAALMASSLAGAQPAPEESASAASALVGDEVVSLRTRDSKTFRTADAGVLRRRIWDSPVHYRLDGAWVEADNRLVPGRPGFVRNAANEFGLEIALQPSPADFLRFDHGDGLSVTWGALGAHLPQGVVTEGSSLTLSQLWPNVDVELQSTPLGLKEDLVLRSAVAQREFVFPMSITGGTARLSAAGEVEILDTTGAVRGVVPHGYMFDSAGSGLIGAESSGVFYELIPHGEGQALRVRLDDAWLNDPARVWPVRVDPNYLFYQPRSDADDTYAANNTPADRSGLSTLAIGHSSAIDPAGRYRRAFMHFTGVPNELDVTNAVLYLTNLTAPSGCSTATVQVHRITSGWAGSSVQTLSSGAPTTSATVDASASAPCGAGQAVNPLSGSNLTATVQGWSNGTIANNGLMVRAANESDAGSFNYREFYSADGGAFPDRPYLEVYFNSNPGVPEQLSPPSGSQTSVTPTLSGTFESNLDGDTGRLFFEVYNNSSGAFVTSGNATAYVGQDQTSSWTVPTALSAGVTYKWRARAQDDRGAFSGWSTYLTFTARVNTNPNVPTDLSPASGAVVTTTPSLSGTFSDPDGDTGRLALEVIRSSDSVQVASGSGGAVASNGTSSWTVPAGSLTSGTAYQWRARAVDAYSATSAWTPYRSFTALDAPAATSADQLGLEPWWSYTKTPVGPQGDAWVNVSSGNLVVQQLDSTPVQAHGQLAFVLRRTYNSQASSLLSLPGPLSAAGWSLNLSEAGDLTGAGLDSAGLLAPSTSVESPGSVTLVDRDGTRHAFAPLAIGAAINVAYLPGSPIGTTGALAPRALTISDTTYTSICVDQTYKAPPGVHLALWRYVAVTAGPTSTCTPLPGTTAKVLGFAAERPDRLRTEFAIDGKILSIIDGAGIELSYGYEQAPVAGTVDLGRLTIIYERTNSACATPTAAGCRAIKFTYPNADSTVITDPAGRQTTFTTTGSGLTKLLTSVTNPDGSILSYTYGGCGGSSQQMCTATDSRGNTTSFTYSGAVEVSPPRIATVTDRRGPEALPLTYTYSSGQTQVDQGTHRRRYQFPSGDTRVSRLLEGDTSNSVLHDTQYTWDTTASPCRQPDNKVDNNLCRLTRASLGSASTNEVTAWSYTPEGNVAAERRTLGATTLSTTYGYKVQQFLTSGVVSVINDQVAGGGNVTTPSRAPETTVLFTITDKTQSLTPRGNDASSATRNNYLTTVTSDSASSAYPNTVPSAAVCQNPSAPTSNTGRVCETRGPVSAPGQATINRYTYDTSGQRLTWATPKVVAEGGAAYTYEYYPDSARDLTGYANAGGWLKAVTDPTNRFVAYAYDRAGNPVRTWDRDATAGTTIASYPSTTNSKYSETLYGPSGHELDQPWRYPRAQRDPLGNRSTVTVDANGNPTTVRPARGTQAGNNSYDTVQTFDAADQLTSSLAPEQAAANKPTTYTYDAFGNRTAVTDPNGHTTVSVYDKVNRLTGTVTDRADTGTPPTGCRAATAADAPIPVGHVVCVTSRTYDGVDNTLTSTDSAGQVTTFTFDAVHRETSRTAPANSGAPLRTDTLYDSDGNPTVVCSPRQFTDGTGSCTTSSLFAVRTTYDVAGRVSTITKNRDATTALVTTYAYDADGNTTKVTDARGHDTTTSYDLLDRKISQAVPRDATTSHTTTWGYSPSGDLRSVTRPGGLITAYSYDAAHHLLDTVTGAATTDPATAGLPSADGGANTRTRNVYDPDGNIVGRYEPRAFTTSVTAPDTRYLTRIDIDRDGRPTSQWVPRYGGTTADPGLEPTQGAECPPTSPGRQPAEVATPASMPAVPGYDAGVGVCATTVAYDPAGNIATQTLATSTGADNRYRSFTWTNDRLLAAVSDPSPITPGARITAATFTYDGAGRPLQSLDALGHGATTAYYPNGQIKTVTEQAGPTGAPVTTYTYDANGNTKTVKNPLLQTTTSVWFHDNLLQSVTDSGGNETSYTYDAVANPATVTSPNANEGKTGSWSTTNTFTFDNLLVQTVDPITNATSRRTVYGYDPAGRKTTQSVDEINTATPPAVTRPGGTQSFTYHPNDRLAQEIGRNGETITHTYDPAGHPTSIADSTSGGSTITASWYLDDLPRVIGDSTATNTYSHNGAGQLAARQRSGAATTTVAYTDGGQVAAVDTPDQGGTTTWAYDSAGRPDTQTGPDGTTLDWTHNNDDTLAQLTNTNGATTVAQWTYTYDKLQRIVSQNLTGQAPPGGTAPTGLWTYEYDSSGRVDRFAKAGGSSISYTWDANGNRLSAGTQKFTYNRDNSIATEDKNISGDDDHVYDGNGNVIDAVCRLNTYDGFDRLTTTSSTHANCGPTTASSTYAYDGLDRQRTSTPNTGPATTISYDGLTTNTQAELTGANTLTWALDPTGAAVSMRDQAGVIRRLHTDGTSNISTITRDGTGLECAARFAPFGVTSRTDGEPCAPGTTPNTVWYRGERRDATTGTYQLGPRTYNPTTATWLQPDTYRNGPSQQNLSIGTDPLTANRYSYVNGDPINWADPTGHIPADCRDPGFRCSNNGGRWSVTPRPHRAPADARPRPEATAFGSYISALRNRQTIAERRCRGYSEYCAEKTWVEIVAKDISGWSKHSNFFGFPTPRLLGQQEIPRPTAGTSGWKEMFLDEDVNPARHVTGFLATGFFYDLRSALASVALSEARSRPGHSGQDQASGEAAVNVGNLLATYPGFGIDEAIAMIEGTFGDPSNVIDGPRAARKTSQSWWVPLACRGTSAC